MDLFAEGHGKKETISQAAHEPLASRMRPRTLEEFVGQQHVIGDGKLLRRAILADRLTSIILYGPPGSGKTTLAQIISHVTRARFQSVNAVTANVQDLRKVIEGARHHLEHAGERTILFIDEIHRFNKAQQDVLMPEVENGTLILIGSTTHNPSFSINGPLLSRSMIFELRPHTEEEIKEIVKRAVLDPERGVGRFRVAIDEEALDHIAKSASGDARRALNALEVGVLTTPPGPDGAIHFTAKVAEESCQRKIVYYDKDEDYHYDTASAFIKSVRGSDPDAAVYWLAKMLYAGEDPRFIIRRLLILASEDIGNADPHALVLASSALTAIEFVGMPEARIILSQAVTYLALAPKSNAAYLAVEEATEDVKKEVTGEVPNHLRDKSYRGAERMGHGAGYQYAHADPEHYVVQEYVTIKKQYYRPTEFGYEKIQQEQLERLRRLSREKKG